MREEDSGQAYGEWAERAYNDGDAQLAVHLLTQALSRRPDDIDLLRRRPFQWGRYMTKTEDRQFNRCDHFKVVAGLDQRLEVARAGNIIFNGLAQHIEADALEQHPDFERAKSPR